MRFRKHPAALRGIVLDCNRYGVKKLSPGLRDYSFDLTVVDGFFSFLRIHFIFDKLIRLASINICIRRNIRKCLLIEGGIFNLLCGTMNVITVRRFEEKCPETSKLLRSYYRSSLIRTSKLASQSTSLISISQNFLPKIQPLLLAGIVTPPLLLSRQPRVTFRQHFTQVRRSQILAAALERVSNYNPTSGALANQLHSNFTEKRQSP